MGELAGLEQIQAAADALRRADGGDRLSARLDAVAARDGHEAGFRRLAEAYFAEIEHRFT